MELTYNLNDDEFKAIMDLGGLQKDSYASKVFGALEFINKNTQITGDILNTLMYYDFVECYKNHKLERVIMGDNILLKNCYYRLTKYGVTFVKQNRS